MPKGTFYKLKPEKRKAITNAFLREFSTKIYDEASISNVVKSLGIAKGSIYQYFIDKLDLFLYLQATCNEVKLAYISNIKREDFPDFWSYYRALYEKGMDFDINHPLESNFLHNISNHINSPSLRELSKEWKKQIIEWMSAMIQHEVDLGLFRNDMPVRSMAFLLFKTSTSIGEYMQTIFGLNIEKQIQREESIYAEKNGEFLMKTVDEYIFLLKNAFNF
jgi:AcrR family transcriptional regulator